MNDIYSEIIINNLEQLQKKISEKTAKYINTNAAPILIVVSKTHPVKAIEIAYQAGQRHFGENRVQELQTKAQELQTYSDLNWHYIGHLQSNKVKNLLSIPNLKYIHSVDSKKLLLEIYKQRENLLASGTSISHKKSDYQSTSSQIINYFLQVNTSGEEQKSGLRSYAELKEIVAWILEQKDKESKLGLNWIGLMTMGRIRTHDLLGDAYKSFSQLKDYRLNLIHDFSLDVNVAKVPETLSSPSELENNHWHSPSALKLQLSMGQSQDFEVALKCGSNFLRIGSLIFEKEEQI